MVRYSYGQKASPCEGNVGLEVRRLVLLDSRLLTALLDASVGGDDTGSIVDFEKQTSDSGRTAVKACLYFAYLSIVLVIADNLGASVRSRHPRS